MSRIVVLGLGNTLLSDDGAGIRVLEAVEAALGVLAAADGALITAGWGTGTGNGPVDPPAAVGESPVVTTPWTTESHWRWGEHELRLISASAGGFAFIDFLTGSDAALIVDAVPATWMARAVRGLSGAGEGGAPGDIIRAGLETFPPSARLASGHEINLAAAVAYARRLGLPMPDRIEVFGILAADVETFSEECTPAVAAALSKLTDMILEALAELCKS